MACLVDPCGNRRAPVIPVHQEPDRAEVHPEGRDHAARIEHRVQGLELGADDYIAKPFDAKELIARIKAVLRRSAPSDPERSISLPGLSVSLENYAVILDGRQLEMPPKEIELLYFLASHAGKVFTREQLLEQVWGFDFFGDSRTVDVHVKRIREKLGENHDWQLKTVWGVGYKFEQQ